MSIDQNFKASIGVDVKVSGEEQITKLETALAAIVKTMGGLGASLQADFAKAAQSVKGAADEGVKADREMVNSTQRKAREIDKAYKQLDNTRKQSAATWKKVETQTAAEIEAQKNAMWASHEANERKATATNKKELNTRVSQEIASYNALGEAHALSLKEKAARDTKAQAEERRRNSDHVKALAEDERRAYAAVRRDGQRASSLSSSGSAYAKEQDRLARAADERAYRSMKRESADRISVASGSAGIDSHMSKAEGRFGAEADAAAARAARLERQLNAAHEVGLRMNARVNQQLAAENAIKAADAYHKSFQGKMVSGMAGVAKTASEAFGKNFSSSMGGGMGGIVTGFLGLFAAKAMYRDNVQDMAVQASLEGAYDGDKAAATKRKQFLMDNAVKYGLNYGQTATSQMNVIATGKARGLSEEKIDAILNGFDAWFKLRGTDQLHQKVSMNAIAQGLGEDNVHAMQINRELNRDLPGIKTEMVKYLQSLGGPVQSSGDFDKLMMGKLKDKDGKIVVLKSEEFWSGFGAHMQKTMGGNAAQLAEKSPLGAVNKLQSEITKLNIQFGQSGAAEGFVGAISEVTKLLGSPEVKGMIDDLGRSAKEFGKSLGPIIHDIGDWVKGHTELIKSFAGVMAKVGGTSLVLSAFVGIVSAIASPFLKLGGAAAVMLAPILRMVGIAPAFEAVLVSLGLKMGTTGVATATFGASIQTLGMTLLRTLGPLAGIIALFETIQGMRTQAKADDAMEKTDLGKMSAGDLAANKRALVEAKEHTKDSWVIKGLDWITGGNDKSSIAGDRTKLLDGQIARYENQEKLNELNTARAAEAAAKQAAAVAASGNPYGTDSKHGDKGHKGRSGAVQSAEMEGAERQYDAVVAEGKRRLARTTRDANIADLQEELAAGKISYETYYKGISDAATAQKKEELDAIEEKTAETVKSLTRQKARDGADRVALDKQIETAKKQGFYESAEVEQKFDRRTAENKKALTKEQLAYDKKIAELRRDLNVEVGRTDKKASDDAIDEKYAADLLKAKAEGNSVAEKTINDLKVVEKAKQDILAVDQLITQQNAKASALEADVAVRVASGALSKNAAEAELLDIKKAVAAENLKALDAELAIEKSKDVQLQNLTKILELEARRANAIEITKTKTRQEVELEAGSTKAMESFLETIEKKPKDIGEAFKTLFGDLTTQMLKLVNEDIAQNLMRALKGEGGGGFLDTLFGGNGGSNAGGDGVMGFLGSLFGGKKDGGSSASSSVDWSGLFASAGATFASGGPVVGKGTAKSDSILARIANGEYVLTPPMIEALGGVNMLEGLRTQTKGYASGGLVSAAAAGSSVARTVLASRDRGNQRVTMNVYAQDASSFRASSNQILAKMNRAGQIATRRLF